MMIRSEVRKEKERKNRIIMIRSEVRKEKGWNE